MSHTNGNPLMKCLVATLLIIALLGAAQALPICSIDTGNLYLCRAAATGQAPPSPDQKCCALVRNADLPCLCTFKSLLPQFGIDPRNALALPGKCGMKSPTPCDA